MKTRLTTLLDLLRTSYWFVPALMSFGAVALALILLGVDHREPAWADPQRWWLYGGDYQGARVVLGVIVGSLISVISVVFSITIVTLALVSGQFGSRILRSFMRDRSNQVTLGTFIATFTYAMVVLGTVRGEEGRAFLPVVAVTMAIALTFLSLAVLVYFIHHVAESIQADAVIRSIAEELGDAVEHLYPEGIGAEPRKSGEESGPALRLPPRFDEEATGVHARKDAYLQAIDRELVMELAVDYDLVVRIDKHPGDFVYAGEVLAKASAGPQHRSRVIKRLAGAFVQGASRTMAQDAAFGIHQLVEIAVRALSPSVNDPFTAETCVDHLSGILRRLAVRHFPEPVRVDPEGRIRIVATAPTFGTMVDGAFDEIRRNAEQASSVLRRILTGIERIGEVARSREQCDVLRRHADWVMRAGQQGVHDPAGLEALHSAHASTLRVLSSRTSSFHAA